MKELVIKLKKRQCELLEIKNKLEKELESMPRGCLRIVSNGSVSKNPNYYLRLDSKDWKGTYIKAKDKDLAIRLAQKDYNQKVLRAAKIELLAIDKFLFHYPKVNVEQIYENLHIERQKLITPIQITDEEYRRNWEMYRPTNYESFGGGG